MVEKRRGKTTNNSSHRPEKLTPNLLTQLEYCQRTVYLEKSISTPCEVYTDSDYISLGNLSSLGHADSTCESSSIPSEYTDYLLYVKERANIIRTGIRSTDKYKQHTKARQVEIHDSDSGDGSSVDSTRGLVNVRQDVTHLNLCDNPGDMWHGLKTSDGKPVVLHPLKSKHGNRHRQPSFVNGGGKKWPSLVKMLQVIRHKNGVPVNDSMGHHINGPINYSGGFLNISRYFKHSFKQQNGGGVKNVGLGKFNKKNTDFGKTDFPIPQHIPNPPTKYPMNQNLTYGATANAASLSRGGFPKDKSRTGTAEVPEQVERRFKPPKGGHESPKQIFKHRTPGAIPGSRVLRKKKRKLPSPLPSRGGTCPP